jgi:4-amino-4-deoxy-L-arabinose transferase-like glycosyltransferase
VLGLSRELGRTALGVPLSVWGLVLVALLMRLAASWVFDGPDLVPASESGLTAANWVSGRGYTFDLYGYRTEQPLQSFMPPLFTTIVAGCLLTPWPEATLGFLQVVLSSVTVLLVYLIGSRLAEPTVGITASALCVVYPPFLVLVDQPTVPVLNTFLLGLFLWFSIRLLEGFEFKWAALTGLTLGLCVLSRPTFGGLLGVLIIALWLKKGNLGRSWWWAAILAAAIMALTISPWLLRNWWVQGRPVGVSTNGGFTFWNGNNPFTTGFGFDVVLDDLEAYSGETIEVADGIEIVEVKPYPLPLELRDSAGSMDEVALDRAFYQAAFQAIRQDPRRWAHLTLEKAIGLWWFRPNIGLSSGFYQEAWILPYKIIYVIVLLLAITGLAISFRSWRRYVLLYGVLLYLSLAYIVFNVITRYRWEMKPYLFIFTALALVRAGRWLAERRTWPSWSW